MLDAAMPELPAATGGAIPTLRPHSSLSDMKKLMMSLTGSSSLVTAPVTGRPN